MFFFEKGPLSNFIQEENSTSDVLLKIGNFKILNKIKKINIIICFVNYILINVI